jgi:hypothetical protein
MYESCQNMVCLSFLLRIVSPQSSIDNIVDGEVNVDGNRHLRTLRCG